MKKGNPWALLPIAVFLVVFIGCGVLFEDFYAMPAIVGFLIALVVAFLQNPKRSFAEKLSSVTKNMGDENVMIMCLIFVPVSYTHLAVYKRQGQKVLTALIRPMVPMEMRSSIPTLLDSNFLAIYTTRRRL